MSPAVTIAGRTCENLLSFFFPPLCILCDAPPRKGSLWLCEDCGTALTTNHDKRRACPRCSLNQELGSCTCDLVWDHPFERIYSLFDFDENVRRLVHQIKYKGRGRLAYDLGALGAAMLPDDLVKGVDGVVAIPLHPFKQLRRGYNQAERFARGLAEGHEGLSYLSRVVKRTRNTRTQTKLDREDRRRNLAGAFRVDPQGAERIRGKTLILVDDVVTTGATTAECTRALLEGGAEAVRVVSLARD